MMLEESEGQGSRLRGERQGGRQRKRGSQVRVSDGDRQRGRKALFEILRRGLCYSAAAAP